MKTVIIGGGKIGYYLAKTLRDRDRRIIVIEKDEKRSQFLANELDIPVICGNGAEQYTLKQANIEPGDTVVSIAGKDQDNLVVCQLAKTIYGVQKTVARVSNPKNVLALKKLGADIVVSATDSIIKQLEREVDNSSMKELLSLGAGRPSVLEVQLPPNYVYDRRQLCDINLPDSCNIVSISRGEEFIIPRGKTKLMSLDTVLIVVASGAAAEVRKALKLKK